MSKSYVIVLATSKGGAGKTTLAQGLLSHWFSLGHTPAIIDADPQEGILKTHNPDGPLARVPVIGNAEESIGETIEELKENYSPVIVDTGGFRNRTNIMAIANSDLVLIPLKPSTIDVSGAVETYELVQEINETPERKGNPIKAFMVLTMTQKGTVIARHVRDELEAAKYPLLKSEMANRVAYPEASIQGLSPVILAPDSIAARDIAAIASELKKYLGKTPMKSLNKDLISL